MKKSFLLVFMPVLLVLGGCHQGLKEPESVDPVYNDLTKEANRAFGAYKEAEKNATEALKAFEEAPVRTGQRLSAQEEYFSALHQQEKSSQKYRYFALKAEMRQKYVRKIYPDYFHDSKTWPDLSQWEDYQVDKRLQNAPKVWDPDTRIKQRKLASKPQQVSREE